MDPEFSAERFRGAVVVAVVDGEYLSARRFWVGRLTFDACGVDELTW
jgi:hypothetical protein